MIEEKKNDLVERPKEVFEITLVRGNIEYITAGSYDMDEGGIHRFSNPSYKNGSLFLIKTCARYNGDRVESVVNIKDRLTHDEAKTVKESLKCTCNCKNKLTQAEIIAAILQSSGMELAQIKTTVKSMTEAKSKAKADVINIPHLTKPGEYLEGTLRVDAVSTKRVDDNL